MINPMMFFAAFMALLPLCAADLMRTVYCANRCNNYLKVPESNIPQCQPKHLLMNQCGTVISCSWADVEIEKNRRTANSTEDVVCCYDVQLKENGACDAQQTSTISSQNQLSSKDSMYCVAKSSQLLYLFIFLITSLFAQSLYIMWSIYNKKSASRKIAHIDEVISVRPIPIFQPRPICETKLLSNFEF